MSDKRPDGAGTITQRKDGQWEGRIRYRDEGHKLIIKACFAPSKEECELRLEELRISCGVIDKRECSADMPFKDWCKLWLRYEKASVSVGTFQTYERQIALYFEERIGDIPLNEITTETIGRLYSNLRRNGRTAHVEENGEGISLGTIYTIHRLMKAIFKKALMIGVIETDPTKNVKIPKLKSKELYIFSNSEIKMFLNLSQERGIYLPVLLALCTGLTRGELVALRWRDFNFSTGELKVKRLYSCVKGEPEIVPLQRDSLYRSIYLPKELLEIVHSYKKASDSLWVFPSVYKEDRPKNPNDFTLKFKAILRDMGCERATFASLRDTFAVEALNHGIDIRTLTCALGYRSVRGVMRAYLPLMDKNKRDAANKIEGAMYELLN